MSKRMEDVIIYALSGVILAFIIALFKIWERRVGIAGEELGEPEEGALPPTRGMEKMIELILPKSKKIVSKPPTDEEWKELLGNDEEVEREEI